MPYDRLARVGILEVNPSLFGLQLPRLDEFVLVFLVNSFIVMVQINLQLG